MSNVQTMRFRIGLFVLGALLLLGVLIALFGSFPSLFIRSDRYTIQFSDAPGVGPGTPVRRSGVRVGAVESLMLDDDTGQVFVKVLIERPYKIRRSEQPTLVHGLLGGDTTIDLIPKTTPGEEPDRTPVPPGSQLAGVRQANVGSLLNQASGLMPESQETLNEMRRTMQRLERMAPLTEETMREYRDLARISRQLVPELRATNTEIQELAKATRATVPELRRTNEEIQVTARNWGKLGERLDVFVQTNQDKLTRTLDHLNNTLTKISTVFSEENQSNLNAILKNVRTGTENLGSIAKSTDDLMRESQKTIQRINGSVTRADDVLTNLQQVTKPLAERSERVMKNLDESTNSMNLLLLDVRSLLAKFDQGDGTLRKLLFDPALYNHLDQAACSINRLMPWVEKILRDMGNFADQIARHPEKLGIGGVIRPSSGVKESPSAPSPWIRPPGN